MCGPFFNGGRDARCRTHNRYAPTSTVKISTPGLYAMLVPYRSTSNCTQCPVMSFAAIWRNKSTISQVQPDAVLLTYRYVRCLPPIPFATAIVRSTSLKHYWVRQSQQPLRQPPTCFVPFSP